MTKQEVQTFRGDFQKAVAQLEEQYGVNISLGTIRYDVNGLSAKMKDEKDEMDILEKIYYNIPSDKLGDKLAKSDVEEASKGIDLKNLTMDNIFGYIKEDMSETSDVDYTSIMKDVWGEETIKKAYKELISENGGEEDITEMTKLLNTYFNSDKGYKQVEDYFGDLSETNNNMSENYKKQLLSFIEEAREEDKKAGITDNEPWWNSAAQKIKTTDYKDEDKLLNIAKEFIGIESLKDLDETKNVKVKGPQGLFSVTPSLLIKK